MAKQRISIPAAVQCYLSSSVSEYSERDTRCSDFGGLINMRCQY